MLSLLELSVTGGILIAAVVIIRALSINKLPKKAFLILWAVALCRLFIPLSIPSPVSVYSAAEQLGVSVRRPGVLVGQAAPAPDAEAQIPVLLLVWAAVALVCALLLLIVHLRSRREYAASLPVEHASVTAWLEAHRLRRPIQVRYSDQIDAPLTYGILWPVILLPKSLDLTDETRLNFILAHEMAHIRRFDALIKWILAAALCLHWFNPLVWVMYVLANRDLELSCDESVVRMYGASARAPYALTLVGLEERRARFSPLASSFSKSAMEERIAAIMKSKKTTFAGIALALALVVVVTTVFATSSPGPKTPAPTVSPAASPTPSAINTTNPLPGNDGAVVDDSDPFDGWDNTDWEKPDPQTGHYYTQAQYNLVSALKTEGYEKQSIATFNRTIRAKMNEDEKLSMAYEMLRSDLPQDDPLAPFVYNTIQSSLEEYNARVDEVYSGKQVDPSFRGSNQRETKGDVFGDSVQTGYASADYNFTYRILNQDKLTVAARDAFLQSILSGVQTWLEKQDMKSDADEDALKAEIDRLGKAAGNANIAYTGVEISYFDIESSY